MSKADPFGKCSVEEKSHPHEATSFRTAITWMRSSLGKTAIGILLRAYPKTQFRLWIEADSERFSDKHLVAHRHFAYLQSKQKANCVK